MLGLLSALLLLSGPQTVQLTIDGQVREALVYVPSAGHGPAPVVFGFHGHTGTSRFAALSFLVQKSWPEAVVIYPQGLPTSGGLYDPQGKFSGWKTERSESNRDIRFVDALYDMAIHKYNGDPHRVFAMGHSHGGFFIYCLWALRADRFAGFGSFEAAAGRAGKLQPKPLFVTIGDQDRVVPVAMQRRSFNAMLKVEGFASKGTPFGEKGTLYPGTQPVVLWSYDGGHMFPQDAVPAMVNFFKGLKN